MPGTLKLAVLGATLALAGCVAAVVGTVAVTTVDIATDRRSAGKYIDDNTVELKISSAIAQNADLHANAHINVTSMNGIVLLTGETPVQTQRRKIVELARGYEEVRQVVNEIQIAGQTSLPSRTNDAWLTTKVKTRLYEETSLTANRVKVVTEHGVVYLMGLVTPAEADAAVTAVRTVKGVSRVMKVFEYES